MNIASNTDVLIVGAGPTGLMLACQLAIHKISFRIIDKTKDHTAQSRALVIQARSLEILDQMGIVERQSSKEKLQKQLVLFLTAEKYYGLQ